MKHVHTTLSSLVALSLLVGGCAPSDKSSKSTDPQAPTNKSDVLAHGTPNEAPKDAAAQAAAATAEAAPAEGTVKRKPRNFEAKGMYVTSTSVELPRFKTMIADMKAAGGNTIVFDAKDEWGIVFYDTKVPLAEKIKADKDRVIKDLKAKVAYAHSQGVHVAGRVVVFQDPILAKARPDLCPTDATTGGVWKELGKQMWLDPSKKEVQDYAIALGRELAELGVDEVQWDYVRFPAMGKTQNARYAFDMKAQQKHDIITGFVKRAYEELKPTGVMISADVYGIMAWAQPIDIRITGQKIEDMANHVDVLCPMVYPSHFNDGFAGIARPANQPYMFVHKGVDLLQKKVKGTNVTIRPWLQAMPYKVSNFTPAYVSEQLRASRDTKAVGWLLWNAQNKYDTAWAGVKSFSKQSK
jgi:hypothetical protein